MPKLVPISWKKFEKFVLYIGCTYVRHKGDHRIYTRDGLIRPVVFPEDRELAVFVVRNNLRILGISVDEYLAIIKDL